MKKHVRINRRIANFVVKQFRARRFSSIFPMLSIFLLSCNRTVLKPNVIINNNIPLGQGINLYEIDDNNKRHELNSAIDVYDVDTNSVIYIALDRSLLSESIPRNNDFSIRVEKLPPELVNQRNQLLKALSALNEYVSIAQELVNKFQENLFNQKNPELTDLITKHGNASTTLGNVLQSYLQVKATRREFKGLDPIKFLGELYEGTDEEWNLRVRNYIQQEIKNLDQESEDRIKQIKSNANPFSLQLSATLYGNTERKPERIHLPGYDDLEEGQFRSINKVSFSISPEDKTKLQTEVAFSKDVANRLNETKSIKESIRATFKKIFDDTFKRVQTCTNEASKTFAIVQEIVLTNTSLSDGKISELLSQVDPSIRTALIADYSQARTSVMGKVASVKQFEGKIKEVVPTDSQLATMLEGNDPVEILNQFIQMTTNVPGSIESAYEELKKQLTAIPASHTVKESSTYNALAALKGETKTTLIKEFERQNIAAIEIQKKLDELKKSQIDPLINIIKTIKNNMNNLDIGKNGIILTNGLDASLIESKSIVRTTENITDTKVNLNRTSRSDGDNVEHIELLIVARQTDVDGVKKETQPILGERRLVFKIRKFGAYNDLSSGAAAFYGTDSTDLTKEPEFGALATWVIHKRTRHSKVWNFSNPGLGFHTAAIATGLGVGGSLHFLPGNFIQIGGGRTFRTKGENHWYLFVGFRLANFNMPKF